MSKPKGNKRQRRASHGKARAGRGKLKPGILESWEDFNEAAMAEYLEAVAADFAEQLDLLEESLRCEN
jgi:hypothetical protein